MNKVCHFTSVHPINDVRIFSKECLSLSKYGFDVTLIGFDDKAFEDVENNIKRISLYVPVKNRIQRMLKRSKVIFHKAMEVDADIYHLHDPELLYIGWKLKKRGKIVIYDSHEDVPQQILNKEWIPFYFRKIISLLFLRIENYLIKRLDAVITVSDEINKRFFDKRILSVVIHNYASLNEFSNYIPWNTERTRICYVGGISKIRGIIELTKSLPKANTILELAGKFESQFLEKEIVGEQIIYHGKVTREELKIVFSRCFAGIITYLPVPNHDNSSPNKLFEYMASGLPVIASNFKSWKEIIEGNHSGICVDPTNIDSISNAIVSLKNNPHLAKLMGYNARKAFEEKYNWQIDEIKLIKLYNDLLGNIKLSI